MSAYLDRLQKLGVSPNFWTSETYWKHAGWMEECRDGKQAVRTNRGINMLPVYDEHGLVWGDRFWAGFKDMGGPKFLDFEFIYDPANFTDISGERWRKVRKNLGWTTQAIGPVETRGSCEPAAILEFFEHWVDDQKGAVWYDPSTMVGYLGDPERKGLYTFTEDGQLVGVCLWDENWKYINFRYCLVKHGVNGLSDTSRLNFYRVMANEKPGKLVNDGGSLDRDSLYQYKLKLNPVEVNKIFGGGLE